MDKIYIGSLANGGATPDYSQSTSAEVSLFIRRAIPDESFIMMVFEKEKRHGSSLSVWTLIMLSLLKEHRRLTMSQLHEFSRLEERQVVSAVEDLVEAGVVEASGSGTSRSYIQSSKVYKADNALPAYVRQNNISVTRQQGLVLELAEKNGGEVTSSEVMNLLGLSYISTYRLLKKMKLRHDDRGRSSCQIPSVHGAPHKRHLQQDQPRARRISQQCAQSRVRQWNPRKILNAKAKKTVREAKAGCGNYCLEERTLIIPSSRPQIIAEGFRQQHMIECLNCETCGRMHVANNFPNCDRALMLTCTSASDASLPTNGVTTLLSWHVLNQGQFHEIEAN